MHLTRPLVCGIGIEHNRHRHCQPGGIWLRAGSLQSGESHREPSGLGPGVRRARGRGTLGPAGYAVAPQAAGKRPDGRRSPLTEHTMSDVHAAHAHSSWRREASSIPAGPYATDASLKKTSDVVFDDLYPSSIMGAYARQPSVGKGADTPCLTTEFRKSCLCAGTRRLRVVEYQARCFEEVKTYD